MNKALRLSLCLAIFVAHLEVQPQAKALSTPTEDSPRAMTPADLLRQEGLGEVAIAPGGHSVAYVVKRSKASSQSFRSPHLSGSDRGDVWISSVATGKSQNITNGAVDGSGFWAPRWSPDGQRLGMFSTRRGNLCLWIWTRSSGELSRLSEQGIDNPLPNSWEWVSDSQIVLAALPHGKKSTVMTILPQVAETTSSEWSKAWKGQESTASVLESGVESSMEERPQAQALLIDAATGKSQVLSSAAGFFSVYSSPDRRFAALERQIGIYRPDAEHGVRSSFLTSKYELVIADLGSPSSAEKISGVRDIFPASVRWSPDGTELAVLGYDPTPSEHPQIFRCKAVERSCQSLSSIRLDRRFGEVNYYVAPPYLWFGNHDLLVQAAAGNSSTIASAETEWKLVSDSGEARRFFTSGKIPDRMFAHAGTEGLIGILDGSIWRIGKDGAFVENLTPKLNGKVTSVVWPAPATEIDPLPQLESSLILAVGQENSQNLYHLDLRSGRLTPLPEPKPGATLIGYSQGAIAAFSGNDRSGTCLWVGEPGKEEYKIVFLANTFLRQISEGELRKLEYRGLDGQSLKGWYILPYGYQEGKRYPVVAWVYLNLTYGDDPPPGYLGTDQYHINSSSNPLAINLQLLAAHGYVVLLPSMPSGIFNREPYADMTKGVLPAVEKLVDLGIADGDRIGVMGHSYGGFTVEGLITQTNRFKAAVAMDGFSDYLSWYGAFDMRARYTPFAHESLFRMTEIEYLGGPPWKDLERYLRNSPITHVEQVHTPVMIIHGDLDYVPIQQAEEFFTALYRQNKRAELVRYWGEDHLLDSPANIQDMWQRVYSWFDRFLVAPGH